MYNRFRSVAALVITSVFLSALPLSADSGGGGSVTEETDSNDMTYITIALAVLVGGYLIYDAITDSGEETVVQANGETGIIDTGVDWDRALEDDTEASIALAVSVLPGPDGRQRAAQLISALREMSDGNVTVYDDPVDLGSGPEVQRAALASEFFGTDFLIYQVAEGDSLTRFGLVSADSLLWISEDQSGNSMLIVATELLQSGVF